MFFIRSLNDKKNDPYPWRTGGQVLRLYELGLVSAKAAIAQLKVYRSTFYRQLKKYKSEGLVALRHGNSGKEPINKLDPEVKQRIEHLLLTRYAGFQPALVKKYLAQEDGISVSEEYIRRLLKKMGDRPNDRSSSYIKAEGVGRGLENSFR